mgnify:CR=1 FL=1
MSYPSRTPNPLAQTLANLPLTFVHWLLESRTLLIKWRSNLHWVTLESFDGMDGMNRTWGEERFVTSCRSFEFLNIWCDIAMPIRTDNHNELTWEEQISQVMIFLRGKQTSCLDLLVANHLFGCTWIDCHIGTEDCRVIYWDLMPFQNLYGTLCIHIMCNLCYNVWHATMKYVQVW